jgi:hypothetical protein
MSHLTAPEQARLDQLELIIAAGKQSFVDVGLALQSIQEERLYRKEYGTFEEYCQERWGWSRRRGYQIIKAAETVRDLPPKTAAMIDSEWTARAVSKLPPEKRVQAVEKASSTGVVSASKIGKSSPANEPLTEKVRTIVHTLPPPPARPPVKPVVQAVQVLKDRIGREIPTHLHDLWYAGDEVATYLHTLSKLRTALKAVDEKDMLYRECNVSHVLSHLEQAYVGLKTAIPHTVCPVCQGKVSDKCRLCLGRGMISKFRWERAVPEETKAMVLKTIG